LWAILGGFGDTLLIKLSLCLISTSNFDGFNDFSNESLKKKTIVETFFAIDSTSCG
jgi:hypothetical protein